MSGRSSSPGGVFAVSRGIFEDPDFPPEPFTQREAFIWLVASAAWKEHKTRGSFGPVILERGEFCFSVRFLAERWKWSKSRVDRFILALKKRDTIRDSKRDREQVWIINKYNDFQILAAPKRDSKRDTKRDSSGTAAGQQRDKEEDIEDIEDIESSSLRSERFGPDEAFSEFCEVVGKAGFNLPKLLTKDRREKLKARLAEHGREAWAEAVRRMAASKFCRGENERGWKADLDFVLQSKSFNGLIEGKYDDKIPVLKPAPKTAFQQHQDECAAELDKVINRSRGNDEFTDNIIDLAATDFRGHGKADSGR